MICHLDSWHYFFKPCFAKINTHLQDKWITGMFLSGIMCLQRVGCNQTIRKKLGGLIFAD